MVETIFLAIVAAAPAIAAIFTIIAAVVKMVRTNKSELKAVVDAFNELKNEVVNVKEYSEVKRELAAVHRENAELKKQMNELLTELTRINRTEK